MIFKTNSYEETFLLGFKIGQLLKSFDIVCLIGDLGVGKTAISGGIAKGLEIDDYITSPTFTLVNEYMGKVKLFHFDVYRLTSPDDLVEIGYYDYLGSDGIVIIEWANLIKDEIPKEHIIINLSKAMDLDENVRMIEVRGIGNKYFSFEKEVEESVNIGS